MRTPRTKLAATCAAVLLGLAVLAPPPAAAQERAGTGKWFVLRTSTGSQCWTARLIQVSGQYASGSAQIAGGPFETEERAQRRLDELDARGTCRSG